MVPVAAGIACAGAVGVVGAGIVWAGAGAVVCAVAIPAPVRAVAVASMARVFIIKILPFFWRRSGIASRRMVKGRPAIAQAKRPVWGE
jgi:hypothetical protein